MTSEELRNLAATLNAGNHAGTVDDPIPQQLLYTKTSEDGTKKVYTVAAGIAVGGSGAPAADATDTVKGINKLSDAIDSDLDAATGVTAATPKAVKLALAEAKRYTDENGGGGGTLGYVVTPTITTPAHDATNVSTLPTIAATPYKNVFGTEDPRAHRVFQVASDSGFGTLLVNQNVNADSYAVTTQLTPSTKLYCRVRDVASSGYKSEWSHTVAFTTAAGVVANTPVVTLHGYADSPTDILSGLRITTSAYSVSGGALDAHRATSWAIATKDGTRANVWESLEDTTNKTSITVPDGTLQKGTAYTLSVTFHGTTSFDSSPAVVEFTTSADFGTVNAPTLTVEGGPNTVYETPTLTGGAFSNTRDPDTHDMTDWEVLDATGVTPIWQSLNDTSNKTTIGVQAGKLLNSTAYKARVRYHGAKYGWSAYTTVDFTTVAIYSLVNTPTITIQGGTSNVPEEPVLNLSEFSGVNATYASTNWKVLRTSDSGEVWSGSNSGTSITVPAGNLAVATSYKFMGQYVANEGVSSSWAEVVGTTAAEFKGIKRPTLSLQSDVDGKVDYVTSFVGSQFEYIGGEDTCDKVDWELYKGDDKVWSAANSTILRFLGSFTGYTLETNTQYVLKYRQHAKTNDVWSDWAQLAFTTVSEFTNPTIHFRITGGKFNLSKMLLWYEPSLFQVYKNGSLDASLTSNINQDVSASGGCEIEIKHIDGQNKYPYICFNGLNDEDYGSTSLSILAPLPTLYDSKDGEASKYFAGGFVKGVLGGPFYNCRSLTSLPDDLFKFNPQITTFGGMGGGCGGGAYNDLNGGNGGGVGGGNGGNGGGNGGNGGAGYGCFTNCSGLTSIPESLFAYCPNVVNFGGVGGGGGGSGGGYSGLSVGGGNGGAGYGCFTNCSGLTSIPESLFAYCPNVVNFGGLSGLSGNGSKGGVGGAGYGCFTNCSGLTSIPESLFAYCPNVVNLLGIGNGGGAGGGIGANTGGNGGVGGGGGSGGWGGGGIYGSNGGDGSSVVDLTTPHNNKIPTSGKGIFAGCTGLTTVPQNLLRNFGTTNDVVGANLIGTFEGCSQLSATLYFDAPNIAQGCVKNFAKGNKAAATVFAKSSSTTYNSFHNETTANCNVIPF